jgi:hypothetical protein
MISGVQDHDRYETETCHSNAHLALYRMEDVPAFVDKRRCAPSNAHLSLLALSETRHTNMHLPFVTKSGASQILNKLRCSEKQSI